VLGRTVSAPGVKYSDGQSLFWLKDTDAIVKIGQNRYRNYSVINK
jgi:membrane-bound inhibitor of C-type lysozyme